MIETSQAEKILMAQKLSVLKAQLQEDFKVSYELIPKPDSPYTIKEQQLKELLKNQYTLTDLDKVDDIILGILQGMSTEIDVKTLLKERFGFENEQILSEYLKSKVDAKNYGLSKKDKGKQIYEVKNQKVMDSLYNIKDIKNARKLRSLYRNMIKAISKFIDSYEKSSEKSGSELFSFYYKAFEQQRKFIQYKSKTVIPIIERDAPIQNTQIIPQVIQNIQKLQEQNAAKSQKADNEQIKTNLGSGEKTKNEKKKEKREQKEKKQKTKKEKPEEEIKLDISSDASSISVQPKKKDQPKILNFFKLTPKKPTNEIIKEQPDHQNSISIVHTIKPEQKRQLENTKESLKQQQQNSFIEKLLQQKSDYNLSDLRNQITMKTMDEEKPLTDKYVNIVFWDSRLQYQNYPAPFCYFMQFTQPFKYQQQVRYLDDSADIYEDLIGENLEQNNDNQMEQEEQGEYSGNNTIVPDDYFSEVEISSQAQQIKGFKTFRLLDGRQQLWQFSKMDTNERVDQYKMVLLCQQFMPLQLIQNNNQNQNLPLSIRIALLKQIHGYYKPRENLLKQLLLITDKLSKNGLNNFIKQNSSKVGNQRMIKQQIIDEIKQGKEDIDKELQQAKQIKDMQLQQTQQIKNNEKELKLQKAILEYDGSKYILDLIKYLKEKDFKINKKELDEFISSRVGQAWEQIKKDFKKIKRKQAKEKEKEPKCKEEKQIENNNVQSNPDKSKEDPQPNKTSVFIKPLQSIFKQIEEDYEKDPEKLNEIRRKKQEKLRLQQEEEIAKQKMKKISQQKQVNYGDDPGDSDFEDPAKKKRKGKKAKIQSQNKMDVENMCEKNEEGAIKPQIQNQAMENQQQQVPTRRAKKKVNYRKFIED